MTLVECQGGTLEAANTAEIDGEKWTGEVGEGRLTAGERAGEARRGRKKGRGEEEGEGLAGEKRRKRKKERGKGAKRGKEEKEKE